MILKYFRRARDFPTLQKEYVELEIECVNLLKELEKITDRNLELSGKIQQMKLLKKRKRKK